MTERWASVAGWLRRGTVLWVAVVGIAASLVAHGLVKSAVDHARAIEFERRTDLVRKSFRRTIDEHVELVRGLAGFHTASESVSRDEFEAYTERLLAAHDTVHALEWAPVVASGDRAVFEAEVRETGPAGFSVKGWSGGEFRRREDEWSDVYHPVLFVEPLPGNESALGIDLSSEPVRREALERAAATGNPSATAHIRLVQDEKPEPGFLLFVPVYERGVRLVDEASRRGALRGHALGVFRIRQIAEAALEEFPLDAVALVIRRDLPTSLDGTEEPSTDETFGDLSFGAENSNGGDESLRRETFLTVAGRTWPLEFRNTGRLETGLESQPRIVLIGGLLVTTLLASLAYALSDRAGRIEVLAEERAEKLESATRRLGEVFESAFDAIVVIGANGHVRRWNRAAERIFGWPAAEAVGQPLEDLVVPLRYHDEHRAGIAHFVATGESRVLGRTLDVRALRRFGGEFPVELTVTAVGSGDDAEFTAIVRDVSERVAHARRLENVSRKLEHILNAIEDGVFGIDERGRLTFVNRAAAEMVNWPSSALPGRRAADVFGLVPVEGAEDEDPVVATVLTGEARHVEGRSFSRAGGTEFPITLSSSPIRIGDGSPTGAVVVFRDVSERAGLVAELRGRNERLRVITDSLPAFVSYVDADERYRFNNAYYERMFGIPREKFEGRPIREILGDRYERFQPVLERVLAGETVRYGQEVSVPGGELFVDITCLPHRDESGRVVGFYFMGIDVTERHRSEELARVLFEQSSDAHLIFDGTGILECNRATVEMLRAADKSEILGRHPAEFSPDLQPDGRTSAEKSVEMDALAREHGFHRFDWIHTRLDGEEFPCEVTLTPVLLSSGPALLVVWHDISARYAHEAQLEHQRTETQLLLDRLPAFVWFKDASNTLLRVNQRVADALKLPVEAIEGHPSEEFYPDPSGDEHREDLEVLESGRPLMGRLVTLSVAGEMRWIRTDKIPLPDETGEVNRLLVVSTDVTQLKRAEQALQESERRFRGIFHQTFQFIGLLSPNGTVVDVNRTALESVDAGPEDVIGRPFWEAPWWTHSPEQQERLRDAIRRAAAGEFIRFETTHPTADGRTIDVDFSLKPVTDESGEIVFLIPEGRDITDLRSIERELEDRTRERDTFFNRSLDMLCVAGVDGYFQRVNPSWERTLGYTDEELCSRPFVDFVHEDDVESTLAALGSLSDGGSVVDFRNRYRCKDGSYRWLSWSSAPPDDKGRITAAARDVTENIRAQRELAEKSDELARSNEDLDQFAYVASHDLRSPLRGITNLAEWIREDLGEDLPPESREHLRLMQQQCRRMDELLNGLLEYSRAGRRRFRVEEVDVGELVEQVVALVSKPVGFRIEWPDDLPTLTTERSPLERVFLNLIDNAVKHHTGSDGRVTISWSWRGEIAEFAVEDDGPGIEEAYRDRVFEMFRVLRPRDEVESSGMGLAIVQRLVQHQGGSIHVEPAPSGGCRFVFTWPVRRSSPS